MKRYAQASSPIQCQGHSLGHSRDMLPHPVPSTLTSPRGHSANLASDSGILKAMSSNCNYKPLLIAKFNVTPQKEKQSSSNPISLRSLHYT